MIQQLLFIVCLVGCHCSLFASQDLFDAIRSDDVVRVRSQLKLGVDPNSRNAQGATALMQAALHANLSVMRLLIEMKADVNATNAIGATALMWAAGNPGKVKLLLESGANANAKTNSGRTALIVASAYSDNSATVGMLLKAGAEAKTVDANGDGALGNAATSADPETIRLLLAAGAWVEERGTRGPAMRDMTPLMRAAGSECVECVRMLIAAKADVNAISAEPRRNKAGLQALGKLTPLWLASHWGNREIVRLLIDAGAEVDQPDYRGTTPLIASTASEEQRIEPVRLLLAKGAKANLKSIDGETALDWAHKWSSKSTVTELLTKNGGESKEGGVVPSAPKSTETRTAREAVSRSVGLIQASTSKFFQVGGCVGCHHQMLGGMLVGQAQDRGLAIDTALAASQMKTAVTITQPARESLLLRVPGGGAPMVNALFLVSLGAQKYPADALTDALVHDLAGLQQTDGAWHGMASRPPMEYSKITETAYAMRAIQLYGSEGRKAEWESRVNKGRSWLGGVTPGTTEESALQLLGLHWADVKPAELSQKGKMLLRQQKADGGWSQRGEFASDAYATGQALYALHEAGVLSSKDEAFQKGRRYLLSTQAEDGSWLVRSRSMKFQPYFESGFPYGHEQWISIAATAWASMALLLSENGI